MQSNSSSENGITSSDTNLSPPFVCACRNKTFKSGSSVGGHHQTPSGGGPAPGNESGESAITIMAAATDELTLKFPAWNNCTNLTCTSDDLGLLELKLGNGVEARKSEASRKKSYRHHPYDKGWLSIGICGGSSSGGSSSETTSSERTISDPNVINHGENGVEVCSSKANNAIDDDDLDLKLGVKGYEVDLELRLNSWI